MSEITCKIRPFSNSFGIFTDIWIYSGGQTYYSRIAAAISLGPRAEQTQIEAFKARRKKVTK